MQFMAKDDFRHVNVLIVDGKASNAKLLRSVLSSLEIRSLAVAKDTAEAFDQMSCSRVDAVFCDENIRPLDAAAFSLAVRRSSEVRNPRVPIIIVSNGPHRRDVEAGRDSGASDFIVRPISASTVKRKLSTVLFTPKPFVQTDAFCGPDRRRKRDRRAEKSAVQVLSSGQERRKKRLARRTTDSNAQRP